MVTQRDEIAHTAAPSWALLIWCDIRNIYVQFGSQNGPVVLTYPRNSIGLSAALNILASHHATEGAGAPYSPPPLAIQGSKVRDARFTENQRQGVRDILKKAGVI